MNMVSLFQWCENTGIGAAIRQSAYAFALIESVHLLALAVIGGAVLIVDFRLLGFLFRQAPVTQIAKDVYPWFVGSLIIMLVSGIALFLSESTKCYYSTPFWLKMVCLGLALLFTFTVKRKVLEEKYWFVSHPLVARAVAVVSLSLWFGVGAAGRWIGFSG